MLRIFWSNLFLLQPNLSLLLKTDSVNNNNLISCKLGEKIKFFSNSNNTMHPQQSRNHCKVVPNSSTTNSLKHLQRTLFNTIASFMVQDPQHLNPQKLSKNFLIKKMIKWITPTNKHKVWNKLRKKRKKKNKISTVVLLLVEGVLQHTSKNSCRNKEVIILSCVPLLCWLILIPWLTLKLSTKI